MDLSRSFERAVEGLVHWSVERRRSVLAASAVLTILLVPGIFQIDVHNRMTDWLDPSDPDAASFLRGIDELPSMVDFERTLLEYEGNDPEALLSPDSLREQERLIDAVRADVPDITGVIGPVVAVQLTAYELQKARGEDPTTAQLPASDDELRIAIEATKENQAALLDYTLAKDNRVGLIGFMFDAEPFESEANEVGARIDDAIAAAYAQGFDTLSGEHSRAVGVASVTDHVNGLLTRDILLLGGLGVGLVFILFLVAAGRPVAVVGGFVSLALGLLWTVGLLGWLRVPFNTLNFAILPLVMGNGIDYSIHVLAEARSDKRGFGKGLGRHLGKSLGVPIILVTLTTCIGLATLGFSGSPYLRQMGLTASGSIALIALLSLTFIPAFLATFARAGGAPPKRGSGLFPAAAKWTSKFPAITVAVVSLTSLAGLVALVTTDFSIDVFETSLPEGDPLVATELAYEEAWGNSDVWFVMLEGNVVSDASFAFQQRFVTELVDRGIVVDDDRVFDLARIAEGHQALRSSPGGVGSLLPGLEDPRPEPSAQEQVAALRAEQPYAEIISVVVNDDGSTGAVFIRPPPEGSDVAATDAMQEQIEAAVEAAAAPDDMDVHVYGFKRLARDLMSETQASLQVLYVVSLGTTLALFYGLTRSVRATTVVALPVIVSSLWWFGLLRLFVGDLDVYQLLSLIFITSIGSDYAAYLVYKFRDTNDLQGTLRTTGRAVLFSAMTDAGAFFIFSMTRVRSGGDMLLGAALAIVAIFLATLLIVPGLLRGLGAEGKSGKGNVDADYAK